MCFPNTLDSNLYQKVATIIGNLLCLNYGLLFGISSSLNILYESPDTPLNSIVKTDETSFLGVCLCLGGILGSLIFGYASKKIGPKTALMMCGLLQIGCWGCVYFSFNMVHIYGSRIAGGLAAGGAFSVLPKYIREITEEKNRSNLEATIPLMGSIGIFIGFLLSSLIPYDNLTNVGLLISFVFNLYFPFMPESPYYLAKNGNVVMMEKSLRWLRGIRHLEDRTKPEFLKEVNKFHKLQKGCQRDNSILITNKINNFKLLAVGIVLVIASQFCGVFMILYYCETIFNQLGSPIPAHWAAITLSGAQLLGTMFYLIIQARINRKLLLVGTSLISGLLLLTLAVLETFRFSLTALQIQWFTLSCLAAHLFIANLGFYSLTLRVISDFSSADVRGSAVSMSMGLMWFLALLTVKFYYQLMEIIGFSGLLWFFGSICISVFLFMLCFLPNTSEESATVVDLRSWSSPTKNLS